MLTAAELVVEFTRDRSWHDFDTDKLLCAGVEREFEIIGEALAVLLKSDATTGRRVSDHRKIVSFRNVLIHNYSKTSRAVTWRIVEDDVPVLIDELKRLIAEPHETPPTA